MGQMGEVALDFFNQPFNLFDSDMNISFLEDIHSSFYRQNPSAFIELFKKFGVQFALVELSKEMAGKRIQPLFFKITHRITSFTRV
jgi:hypothetical protein